MSNKVALGVGELSLDTLRAIWHDTVSVEIHADARAAITASQDCVDRVLEGSDHVYGINTGFGSLANVAVPSDELVTLQENLLLSHSAGVGDCLDDRIVRLVLVLKAMSLAAGYSGVSMKLIESICALINAEVYPLIPAKGSVGASGDLAPLAHCFGLLLGHGDARHRDQIVSADIALAAAGLAPTHLLPKEGLALLNGTQVSTALALSAWFEAEDLFGAACIAGALSVDAMQGSDTPFDDRIHALRRHAGQADAARILRDLMADSDIRQSHIDCDRVQDPYSIRCQPQVMGACLDTLRHIARVLTAEANAITDNPLIFAASDEILSGGNFHGEPVALVADFLALAIAEIGAMSERRIALLVDPNMSGLPAFLIEHSGVNSGFMMAQVTAAALASENKALAHPYSVDSLPTSANQEDHVSMATAAANRLFDMAVNTRYIVAIELLAAVQGIEFHRPHRTSDILETVVAAIRHEVPRLESDRRLQPDIEAIATLIQNGGLRIYCPELMPGCDSTA
jgi:histidine ammonia-lyase